MYLLLQRSTHAFSPTVILASACLQVSGVAQDAASVHQAAAAAAALAGVHTPMPALLLPLAARVPAAAHTVHSPRLVGHCAPLVAVGEHPAARARSYARGSISACMRARAHVLVEPPRPCMGPSAHRMQGMGAHGLACKRSLTLSEARGGTPAPPASSLAPPAPAAPCRPRLAGEPPSTALQCLWLASRRTRSITIYVWVRGGCKEGRLEMCCVRRCLRVWVGRGE
jgi:hypothetical protein